MTQVIGILAAGASSRMRGRDKLLEEVGGVPLLERQLRIATATQVPVLVAVPAAAGPRREIARRLGVRAVEVADPAEGMGASISALAAEAWGSGGGSLLLHLADMPEIEERDLRLLLSEARRAPDAVIRAGTADGRPGHPVVFPRPLFDDLRRLAGDRGARAIIAAAPDVRVVPLEGERALVDLDTPEEWAAWRASTHG